MARITVEDCVEKVKNRFELVLMAAKRAKDITNGATPSVSRDNDKPTIIALREIAEEAISLSGLEELTKRGLIEDKHMFINNTRPSDVFIERDDNDVGEVFDTDDLDDEDLDDDDLDDLDDLDDGIDDDIDNDNDENIEDEDNI